jgi:hypothetical protein
VTVRRWHTQDASALNEAVATSRERLLTDAAFSVPGIEPVEIHHDRANAARGGIPRRLGYMLVAEVAREPQASSDAGAEWSVADHSGRVAPRRAAQRPSGWRIVLKVAR